MCGINRNQETPQSLKDSGPCCAKVEEIQAEKRPVV